MRHILGNFADDGKDLQFEETKAMAKNHFGLLIEAVNVCNAHGDPGVFDVGLKKAVKRRLGRRARGVIPDNLFNLDAERIRGTGRGCHGCIEKGDAQRQSHHANAGRMTMIGRLGGD